MAKELQNTRVVVLDFNTGEVHVYTTNLDKDMDAEAFIAEKGHKVANCHWMSGEQLPIFIH